MRYLVLVSAVLMQMCLGATYSWSVYVQPLKDLTGLQQGPIQIPFTVFYFIFPLSMLIAGNFLPRIGTRRSAMTGGLFFGSGWIVAGFGSNGFIFTILGIGVLAGIGAGMAYIVPIAVCIRWFPNNKGLVTGVAVAGFGGGAALVSQVGGWCMSALGFTPFKTFFFFGLIFLITVFVAGSTMVSPSKETGSKVKKTLSLKEVILNPSFQVLYLAMFTGLAAGFAVNANLKELYRGTGELLTIGVTAVSLFAVANALGRVVWGSFFDKVSSNTAIQLNLFFQSLVLVCAPLLLKSELGFYLVACFTGFNYGGVLVIYVSSASRIWGSGNVGQVYGFLFSSNIPAALSPIVAGVIYDRFQSFDMVYTILATMLICCGVFVGVQKRVVNPAVSSAVS